MEVLNLGHLFVEFIERVSGSYGLNFFRSQSFGVIVYIEKSFRLQLDAVKKAGNLVVSIQSVPDLSSSQYTRFSHQQSSRGVYMSWIFRNSVTDTLLQPLKVFVQEPLLLDEHGGL